MNYKKITAGMLTIFVIFVCSISYAAELTVQGINFKGDFVHISGNLEKEEKSDILIYVMKENSTPQKEDIVYTDNVTTDENGKFSAEFEMNDAHKNMDGIYVLYANSKDATEAVKMNFSFVGKGSRETLINALNSASSAADMKSVIEANTAAVSNLGMTDKIDISEELFNNRPTGGYTDENLTETYNTLAFVKIINTSSSSSIVKNAFDDFFYLIDGRSEDKEDFIADIVYENKTYADKNEINTQYIKAISLDTINHATRENMEQILKDNEDLLGYKNDASYVYFTQAENNTKASIIKYMVQKAESSPFKSTKDITEGLSDAINSLNNSGNSSSSGTSGGGSKGNSTGGNYAVYTPGAGKNAASADENNEKVYFADVAENFWARTAIEALAQKGIVSGYDGSFRPNDNITREEFVTIVIRAFNLSDEDAVSDFTDAKKDEWYYKYISTAYVKNIVSGRDDGSFGVGAQIIRQDAAVILSRLLGAKEEKEPDFIDCDLIDEYAKSGVAYMQEKGIINGMDDGSFAPKKNCTRAEAATMIYKILKIQGGIV